MISPEEIRIQALKWWKPFLQSYLNKETFFPKTIERIGKVTPSSVRENFGELQSQLENLDNQSKQKLGYGYTINRQYVSFRRAGKHSLPNSISFESADDYIAFIDKKGDWNDFLNSVELIEQTLPQLAAWIFSNPITIIENCKIWVDLLKVCSYFLANPKPDLYIRQLPIDIHTKFIEHNEAIIKSLLDCLIPEHKKDDKEKSLTRRFYLKYDEPTIRIRILDNNLKIGELTDLRIPLSDFAKLQINCSKIIITENKMNFLALPELSSTIAIWSGGGFMVSYLREIDWLRAMNILYWGDLDVHGFLILHQARSYFPQTNAIMMDMETFNLFRTEGLGKGEPIAAQELNTLSEKEMAMFYFLKNNNFRLEQEKIPQSFSDKLISSYFESETNC